MTTRRLAIGGADGRTGWAGAWAVAMAAVLLGSGCDRPGARAPGEGRYGPMPAGGVAEPTVVPARAPAAWRPRTNALLSVVQTELSPATLWHSRSREVSWFAGLAEVGLGGPAFLAYSSPTGIALVQPGGTIDGAQMRENWVLAGFAGSPGWVHWDSPWATFLQRRPIRIQLGTNGVHARFAGAAGAFALMPLYGYYKPPGEGASFLAPLGIQEKDLKTWEWRIAVARDPLTRLRYWAGATRAFPVRSEDTVVVDPSRDEVTVRERFEYLEVPDEWQTPGIRIAPVSPTLGLALTKGQAFPVRFDRAPMDFDLPTPYGPYFGVPGAEGYAMTFPVLRYLHETEAPALPVPPDAPAVVAAALKRLQDTARAKFPDGLRYRYDHGGLENFCWAILGDQWYAKALPYYDAVTRSNAVAALGRYFREDVLVEERFVEREFPRGSGRRYLLLEGPGIGSWGVLGDAGKFSANLLQTLWAYAHFTGDHALIRERWPLIRRLFTTGAQIRWVGFGRDEIAELGDEAPPAAAFARLAYLAGDRDAYAYGCGVFARELVHHYVKQRGARWFREQQPWHSMEVIDEEVFLTNLWGDLAGWQMDGPRYPETTGERQFRNRWVRFQDLDVARFYRDHLRADVRQELSALAGQGEERRRFTDDSHILPSLVRLHSFLLQAAVTNLAAMASPEDFAGPPSGVIASSLAMVRAAQTPRYERLIPAAPPLDPVPGVVRDVPGPNPHLVQKVVFPEGRGGWPRLVWWGWTTPTGAPWSFGEVRAGSTEAPGPVRTEPVSWNTLEAWIPAAEDAPVSPR